jgi:hypothetical protein
MRGGPVLRKILLFGASVYVSYLVARTVKRVRRTKWRR